MFCVQEKIRGVANTYNSIMYLRNVYSKAWDKVGYRATCLADYVGSLIAGDSLSNNVFTLFSGFDDDGDTIENFWTDGDMDLGSDHLKKFNRLVINGLTQRDQNTEVYLSFDLGPFVKYYTIEGIGSYVNTGVNTSIGSQTMGSQTIGGGAEVTANPFQVDIPVHSGKFKTVRIKFVATGYGAVQVNDYEYKDIRDKGENNLPENTV